MGQTLKDKKEEETKIDENSIVDFIRDFVAEMENDEGVFASSNHVNEIRKKLQASDIYKLIAAKQRYEKYVKDISSLDPYEYNRIVSEYTDLLMSPKLSAMLPPDKVGKDCLFENPEYELQKIIQKDANMEKTFKLTP